MSQRLMRAVTGLYHFIYLLVEGSRCNYSACLQTKYPQISQVTPAIPAHATLRSVVPVNMPPPKTLLSVASSHCIDHFEEFWSYNLLPISKLFIRMNEFTAKMDLWGFTEWSWKSGRGLPEETDTVAPFPVLAVPSLTWEQLLPVKLGIFWVQLHYREKQIFLEFTNLWKGLDMTIGNFYLENIANPSPLQPQPPLNAE